MAGDLATMKSRVAFELRRADIAPQIALAITDAIAAYRGDRFRFSDTDPVAPVTFNTVADRAVYTAADNANISTAMGIDYIFAQVGGFLQTLGRDTPQNLIAYNQINTMHGQPMWFAYQGNALILSPVPDKAYPITLGLFRTVPAPASDDEAGNPWMTDAEQLIRARAKYEIAVHVTRNPEMAAAMSPLHPLPGQPPGAAWMAWRQLKSEGNRIKSLGRVRSMQF